MKSTKEILKKVCGALNLYPQTPKIKDKVSNASISEIRKIEIGGIKQYILIRGNNKNNPVILFLHGGPGQGEIGYIRKYQEKLEEDFVVVRWEQRGTGLSFSQKIKNDTLTIEQFLNDTKEVTNYLIGEFNKHKIFICGHSWGTVLGILAVKDNPEKYHAYISVGQFVNGKENEKLSYEFVIRKAKEADDKTALKELQDIGLSYNLEYLKIQRKWLSIFGGTMRGNKGKGLMKSLFLSKEYSIYHKITYRRRVSYLPKVMLSQLIDIDLVGETKEIEIPIYFLIGKYDYTTVCSLVEKFYETIKAPKKELIWFEESAHLPQIEENEKFNNTLIRILKENK